MLSRAIWENLSVNKAVVIAVLALVISISQFVVAGLIFILDRNAGYKTPVYEATIASLSRVVLAGHQACDEMGFTIRLLQRNPASVDPSRVERAWDAFVSSGTMLALTADNDILGEYNTLYDNLKAHKDRFIAWKRQNVRETYKQADHHATQFQEQCVLPVQGFVEVARSFEGFGQISEEISAKLRDNFVRAYEGGGDG